MNENGASRSCCSAPASQSSSRRSSGRSMPMDKSAAWSLPRACGPMPFSPASIPSPNVAASCAVAHAERGTMAYSPLVFWLGVIAILASFVLNLQEAPSDRRMGPAPAARAHSGRPGVDLRRADVRLVHRPPHPGGQLRGILALCLALADDLGLRCELYSLWRALHHGRRLCAVAQCACAGRFSLSDLEAAPPGADGPDTLFSLLFSGNHRLHLFGLWICRAVLDDARAFRL